VISPISAVFLQCMFSQQFPHFVLDVAIQKAQHLEIVRACHTLYTYYVIIEQHLKFDSKKNMDITVDLNVVAAIIIIMKAMKFENNKNLNSTYITNNNSFFRNELKQLQKHLTRKSTKKMFHKTPVGDVEW